MVSDPKALHHIYNSGYNIRKPGLRSEITRLLTGPGLAWANSACAKKLDITSAPIDAQTKPTDGSAG